MTQSGDRPERYGLSRRFATILSAPSAQMVSPSPSSVADFTGNTRIASTITGGFPVQSLALREKTRTRSPSRRHTGRTAFGLLSYLSLATSLVDKPRESIE